LNKIYKIISKINYTTYYFKICDKTTKAKAIKLCDDVKIHHKYTKANVDHNFNNCVYDYHEGSDKHAAKYHFKVKDKWLDTSIDFTEGVYYQGDLVRIIGYVRPPLEYFNLIISYPNFFWKHECIIQNCLLKVSQLISFARIDFYKYNFLFYNYLLLFV
jgi:hypothetical protein